MQKCGLSNLQSSAIGDRSEASYSSHHGNHLQRWTKRCGGGDTCLNRHQSYAPEDATSMERALASFHAAVAKEYGAAEAAKAAQDWIEELQKLGTEGRADWRSVTIAAARRLARRVVTPAQD